MIPEERLAAVTRGLREAFDVSTFEEMQLMTKGLSGALIYRIVVNGNPYLLRIITRANDPTLPDHLVCMSTAAKAGLAPRVRYASVDDRIVITDFVNATPLSLEQARAEMPGLLRRLHELPAFPARVDHLNTSCMFLMNRGAGRDAVIQRFLSVSALPTAEGEEFLACLDEVTTAYRRRDEDFVACHNDLFRPENVLFDGTRVWLVDWEAAFQNDRYADLAVVANFLVNNEAQERSFLEMYLERPASEYERARLYLMRQLSHLFYAMAFLMQVGSGDERQEAIPEFGEFHRRVWAGEADLADKHVKRVYGRVHLERMRSNARGARYAEALRISAE